MWWIFIFIHTMNAGFQKVATVLAFIEKYSENFSPAKRGDTFCFQLGFPKKKSGYWNGENGRLAACC